MIRGESLPILAKKAPSGLNIGSEYASEDNCCEILRQHFQ